MTPKQEAHLRQAESELSALVYGRQGPYSHNLVSCVLRSVADVCGDEQANRLVEEFSLTSKYRIQQVQPQEKGAKR
jgi:hypothetical protein